MLEKAKREFRALQVEIRTHEKKKEFECVREKLKQLQGFYGDVKKYYEIAPAVDLTIDNDTNSATFTSTPCPDCGRFHTMTRAECAQHQFISNLKK